MGLSLRLGRDNLSFAVILVEGSLRSTNTHSMDHFDIRRISLFQELQHGNLGVFRGDRSDILCDEEDEDRELSCGSGFEIDGHHVEIMIQESNARRKLDHRERLGE